MDRDSHDAVAPAPNGQNDRQRKKSIASPFERRSLIDRVKLAFSHGLTSHGALTERVVLYGTSGQGKRHVAAQVAKEITQADGRRVLRINGLTFETFVRDYCLLYHDLTGEYLPRGLGLGVTLAKIKHMLEERRQEWLMVITDLGLFSDEPELASSLPDRGHIIVTSDELGFRPTGKETHVTTTDHPFSLLMFANTADEVHVKGLIDAERRQFARYFCPDLLNISSSEFGPVQRWGHAVPLYLKLTAINLQLLRMDFAAYGRFFARQFDDSHMGKHRKIHGYRLALHVATKVMWDTLGDYNVWAQRLLIALTIVCSHPVPLRFLQRLSMFSKSITDHLSPALDFLTSLGLITKSDNSDDPSISIMHHKISSWLWKHLRIRSRDDLHRVIWSWLLVLSTEFTSTATETSSPSGLKLNSTPYDVDTLWQCLPHVSDLVKAAARIGVSDAYHHNSFLTQRQRIMILDLFLNVAETLVSDRRIPIRAGMFVSEAYKALFEIRYLLGFTDYQSYLLRIKLVQIKDHIAGDDRTRAVRELQDAKRVLRLLTYRMQDPYIFNPTSGSDPQVHLPASIPVLDIAVSTAPSIPSAMAFQAAGHAPTPAIVAGSVPLKTSWLGLRQRTFDLEAQLLLLQQQYSEAFFHLIRSLHPTPDETSLADPYVLGRRYYWITCAIMGEKAQQAFEGEALIWSHATMCVWTTLDDNDRWGKGERAGVEVLNWVQKHAELLIGMRKFEGALLFLPRLLVVWQELIPMGDGKLWRLARTLVECYIELDMIREAEKVVERMLEMLNATSNGMTDLSGLGGAPEGGGYENEMFGDGEGREMFWWMLIGLARGYVKVGSVIIAEGIVRFCLGSWRRRHVGEYVEVEIVDVPGAPADHGIRSKTEHHQLKPEMEENVHNRNQNARQRRTEREITWKKSAPTEWWALFVEVLVMQGKVEEPQALVEELAIESEETEVWHGKQVFSRRVDAYRLMRRIYQRALWAEEDGYSREWKMLLGESRERFLLRRAVKAFGSFIRRVREEHDFASDIDLNLESDAEDSKVLSLLDRVWGHKHGFSPRSRWEIHNYEEDVTTSPRCDQSYLCKLWLWCQCKKRRSRAWSIDHAELVRKRFILEDECREQRPKPLRQTTLDAWLYLIIPSVCRPEGCRDNCPCIDANVAGLAQQAALEAKLWIYTEPENPHRIPMKTRTRYKNAKDDPDGAYVPGLDFSVDRLSTKSNEEPGCISWLWYPPEQSPGDHDGENYILPHALDLPKIAITFVHDDDDDAEDLLKTRGDDESVRKYLTVPSDKRLLLGPFARSDGKHGRATRMPKREKQKKKLERLARAFSETPSIVQRDHIKPYLTMDEKTKAKYAEKAKHAHDVLIVDEYCMPVVTMSEDAAEVGELAGAVDHTGDTVDEDQQVGEASESGEQGDAHGVALGSESRNDHEENESQATVASAIETEAADEVGGNASNDS